VINVRDLGEYGKQKKPPCIVEEINTPNFTLMAEGLINLYNQLKEEDLKKIDAKINESA
jgi:hypothetical protein